MNTGSMHCLKSEMSIQPRYDASFLAVNETNERTNKRTNNNNNAKMNYMNL